MSPRRYGRRSCPQAGSKPSCLSVPAGGVEFGGPRIRPIVEGLRTPEGTQSAAGPPSRYRFRRYSNAPGGRRSGNPGALRYARRARSGLLPLGSVRGQRSGVGGVSVAHGGYGEAVTSACDGHPWGQVLTECPMLAALREIISSCERPACSPSQVRRPGCGSGAEQRDGLGAVERHHCGTPTAGGPGGCSRRSVVHGYC